MEQDRRDTVKTGSVLQDRNPRIEQVKKIADINGAAFARVLRGWLSQEPTPGK